MEIRLVKRFSSEDFPFIKVEKVMLMNAASDDFLVKPIIIEPAHQKESKREG